MKLTTQEKTELKFIKNRAIDFVLALAGWIVIAYLITKL